ncbi:hypothetical protein LX32DRAFT_418056 [Colletotrichum zoysiae]|uniref:Uncharacterized protein n=1 Tax=Colletotrichum zoysiae TaxID=1216348 RepID=A0AAD9HSC6_9PEZI|nr:hypothetical protein LX32DRAFT_418056 [Colletotrichum zoysiae]
MSSGHSVQRGGEEREKKGRSGFGRRPLLVFYCTNLLVFPPDSVRLSLCTCATTTAISPSRRSNATKEGRTKHKIVHTTPGIRWSSPTQLLIRPSLAYLWESGRDPEFSNGYGRMCQIMGKMVTIESRLGIAPRID